MKIYDIKKSVSLDPANRVALYTADSTGKSWSDSMQRYVEANRSNLDLDGPGFPYANDGDQVYKAVEQNSNSINSNIPPPANQTTSAAKAYVQAAVTAAFPNDPNAWASTNQIVQSESGWTNEPPSADSGDNTGYFQFNPYDANRYGFGRVQPYTLSLQDQTTLFIKYITKGYGTPSQALAKRQQLRYVPSRGTYEHFY